MTKVELLCYTLAEYSNLVFLPYLPFQIAKKFLQLQVLGLIITEDNVPFVTL